MTTRFPLVSLTTSTSLPAWTPFTNTQRVPGMVMSAASSHCLLLQVGPRRGPDLVERVAAVQLLLLEQVHVPFGGNRRVGVAHDLRDHGQRAPGRDQERRAVVAQVVERLGHALLADQAGLLDQATEPVAQAGRLVHRAVRAAAPGALLL